LRRSPHFNKGDEQECGRLPLQYVPEMDRWTLLVIECGSDVHFEGNDGISVFSSSDWAERGFCSKCGSHLFYRLKKEGHYAVPVGLFDDGEQWVFEQQIFIDEKPSFYSFANQTKNLTGAEVFAQYSAPS